VKSEGEPVMSPLRILFLTNRFPYPIVDGQSRRTYNILKGLSRNHEVVLLSLFEESVPIEAHALEHIKQWCARVELFPIPPKTLNVSMVARLLRSLVSMDPYTIWRHRSDLFLERVEGLTKGGRFDLVHCDILPVAYAIRNLEGIYRAFTDHDVSFLKAHRMAETSQNPLLKLLHRLEAIKLKQLEAQIFQEVDLGVAVSHIDRNILSRLCPKANVCVVENGVDVGEFEPSQGQEREGSLVWVGGFDNYPNQEGMYFFFDKVYSLIKCGVPQVQIDVIGGGVTPTLRAYADVDPSIALHGYVNDPVPYIQHAAVFIVPILSGSGTRLKLLEAMATGKAIVTTTIGCEGIEGEHGVHYLVADSPGEFAGSVRMLLSDRALREKLGKNARQLTVEKYDWKQLCHKMEVVYQIVCGERSIGK
jgi:polysaccharide biosynthesis protein PslH